MRRPRQDGQPSDDGLIYVVTLGEWTDAPTGAASPLYVGGTTGASGRFVTRIGDLLADMHGFFGNSSGHSSGGQHLYEYAYQHRVRPGDLYLGWMRDPSACRRCEEVEWHDRLKPELNRITPPRCLTHARKARQ
jgi:hypothetical protein